MPNFHLQGKCIGEFQDDGAVIDGRILKPINQSVQKSALIVNQPEVPAFGDIVAKAKVTGQEITHTVKLDKPA